MGKFSATAFRLIISVPKRIHPTAPAFGRWLLSLRGDRPDITFSCSDLLQWERPLVYVLRDKDNVPVYVGMSECGLVRPLQPFHHTLSDKTETDKLDVYFFKWGSEAKAFEGELIRTLKPTRNMVLPRTEEEKLAYQAEQERRAERRRIRPPKKPRNGIQKDEYGLRAFVRVQGVLYTKRFPADTTERVMQNWRKKKRAEMRGELPP